MTTMRALFAVACVAAAATVGCGSDDGAGTGAAAESDASLVMGRPVGPFMMQAAELLDAFDGLSLEATDLSSGAEALPLIAQGALAGFDGISEPPLVTALLRDVPVKLVWATNVSPHALLVRPEITGAEDMRGKKIAAPGGTTVQIELAQYLAENGMSLDDVEYVDLDAASIPSAFSTGAIDGAVIWQPQASEMEAAGARVLARPEGRSFQVFGEEFVAEHPDAVQDFVCAMARVQDGFQDDPDDVWNALAEHLDLERSVVPELLPKTAVYASDEVASGVLAPGGEAAEAITAAGQVMKDLDQVDAAPSPDGVEAMIDPTFADKVAAGECER